MAKKPSISPTQRTLEECRARGWRVDKTEYWQANFAQGEVVKVAGRLLDGAADIFALRSAVSHAKRGGPGIRKDLFGFCDIVGLGPITEGGPGYIHAIQCTTGAHDSARLIKILAECREDAMPWLECGGKIWIVSWYKYAEPIERKYWRSSWREVTLRDFRGVA